MTEKESTEKKIRNIRRQKYSAEKKIRIVLEGLRGDESIAELYRLEREKFNWVDSTVFSSVHLAHSQREHVF